MAVKQVRTRFAPSPTGSVHIGSVQKILYSYACAKAHGGSYILRVEDTDRNRYVKGAEEELFLAHKLLGINPDEGIEQGGDYGPYRQSDRLELYQAAAEKLLQEGKAYYSFETSEELAEIREKAQQEGRRVPFRSKYRDYSLEEQQKLAEELAHVVRIKMPEAKEISFNDIIMGEITVNSDVVDDYVLLKSDGFPTYHLAVVVDDHAMAITHVFRGVEWIPTAPVHVLLYQLLDYELPQFAHIPNILDPKGGKLSKRSGSVALLDFFRDGYLAGAILNFMMLLGWSPKSDRELFTLAEFIEEFKLENFNKSNPVFNRDKLDWFNQKYIRNLSPQELADQYLNWAEFSSEERSGPEKPGLDRARLEKALVLEQERIVKFADVPEKLALYSDYPETPDFSHKQLKKLSSEDLTKIINSYIELLQNVELDNHQGWEQAVRGIVEKHDYKPGQVFMALRVAITGTAVSPPLYEFTEIIGREEVLRRLGLALAQIT